MCEVTCPEKNSPLLVGLGRVKKEALKPKFKRLKSYMREEYDPGVGRRRGKTG